MKARKGMQTAQVTPSLCLSICDIVLQATLSSFDYLTVLYKQDVGMGVVMRCPYVSYLFVFALATAF